MYTLICGKPAGVLSQDSTGRMWFRHYDDYSGPPLSVSMPVSHRTYGEKVLRPYLFGLLPDDEVQRKAVATEFGVGPNNPIALLQHMGLDCPGAVQFCAMDDDSLRNAIAMPNTYVPIDDHEIAERLRAIKPEDDGMWLRDGEHWSLGGNQGKFALAFIEERWCSCQGSAATTHIFKNGIGGSAMEALDEFVCMRAARYAGVSVASVSIDTFEDERALIIDRFDRLIQDGRVVRNHQEDLCQALSVMPSQKYTSDGGPTTRDVLMLLGRLDNHSVVDFTEQLFFNYLVGAPDAHAKNFSIVLESSGARLAPMYDVASGFAYIRRDGREWKLAMSIGGENRFGRVGKGAISKFVGSRDPELRAMMDRAGVGADDAIELMARMAQSVPKAMEFAFGDAVGMDGSDLLHDRLMPKVEENCRITLAML